MSRSPYEAIPDSALQDDDDQLKSSSYQGYCGCTMIPFQLLIVVFSLLVAVWGTVLSNDYFAHDPKDSSECNLLSFTVMIRVFSILAFVEAGLAGLGLLLNIFGLLLYLLAATNKTNGFMLAALPGCVVNVLSCCCCVGCLGLPVAIALLAVYSVANVRIWVVGCSNVVYDVQLWKNTGAFLYTTYGLIGILPFAIILSFCLSVLLSKCCGQFLLRFEMQDRNRRYLTRNLQEEAKEGKEQESAI